VRGWGDGSMRLVTIRTRHLVMACALVCALIYALGYAAIDRLEAIRQDCSAVPVSTEENNGPDFDPEPLPLPTFEVL
jgi:hypothetical protein